MKRLILMVVALCFSIGLTTASPCPDCSHLQAQMIQRFQKLDSVVKLRQSYLMGEIEQSKPAIAACLAENQAITSRAFILWILGSMTILGLGFAGWRHTRLQDQAIRALSERLHVSDPSHPMNYQPSQTWKRIIIGGLIACLVLTQFAALLL